MRYFRRFGALALTTMLASVAVGQEANDNQAEDNEAKNQPAAAADETRPRGERFREWVLERFDEDGDGELSDAEREKAREFRRERMEQMQRDGRRPRGPEGRGPAGSGRGARRPDERGPESRWGDPPPGGPGGPRRPGGPGGPGPRGFTSNPSRLFNAFDEDHDEKLSKDEFEKLVGHLQDMRGPREPGRPGPGARPDRPGPGPGASPDGGRGRRWEGDRGPEGRRARPQRDDDSPEDEAAETGQGDDTAA